MFHSKTFPYNFDEIPCELNSYFYRLAYVKIGFIILHVVSLQFQGPIDNVK